MRNGSQRFIDVQQDPEKEIPAKVLEQSIVDISHAMKKITETRLNRRALVALIKDSSGLNKNTIELVLNNLEDLEKTYLRPKEKK